MIPALLRRVASPQLRERSALFPQAVWVTWSQPFRRLLARHAEAARSRRVNMIHLSRVKQYAYTYSTPLRDGPLAEGLMPFVDDLLRFDPGPTIYFMTAMSCGEHGWSLHAVFALLRAAIVRATADPCSVLYAPLSWVGANTGEFPLHADLYRPHVLFNVLENVPSDGSGRTVLLPIGDFFEAVAAQNGIPKRARRRMSGLLLHPLAADGYEEFYDLLHGRHAWTAGLNARLRRRQRPIALRAYEGYLLHDRQWLHGREQPTGGVPRNRLRRLIYLPYDGGSPPSR